MDKGGGAETKAPVPAAAEPDAKRPAEVAAAMDVVVEYMRTLTLAARSEVLQEMEKGASSCKAEGKQQQNVYTERMADIPPFSTDEVASKATETVLDVLAQKNLKITMKRDAVGDWVNAVYMTPFKEDVLRFCMVDPDGKSPSYVDYDREMKNDLGLSKKANALCGALSDLQLQFVKTKRSASLTEPCWPRGEESMTYCAMLVYGEGGSDVRFYIGETKAKKTSKGRWSLSSGHVAGVRDYLAAGLPHKHQHPPNDALYEALATRQCRYVFVYVLGDGTDEDRWEAGLLGDLNGSLPEEDHFPDEPLKKSKWGFNKKAGSQSKDP